MDSDTIHTTDPPIEQSEINDKTGMRDFHGLKYSLDEPRFQGLSKRKIKRMLKDELWDDQKDERKQRVRQKERERRVEKRKLAREGVLERPPSRKKLTALSEKTEVGVIIDCSFGELMTERELLSLTKQLGFSYGKNKRAPKSMKMCITSFDDALKKNLDEKLDSWHDWKEEHIHVTNKHYIEEFEKEKLVYLSADSENTIQTLDEGKAYVIGGIVDKNRYKGLCQEKATENQIETARLPIGDYLQLSTRKVLTVNQVVEIMLKWLEYKDWEKAFLDVIPGRKLKDVKTCEEEGHEKGIESSSTVTNMIDNNTASSPS
ncbi:hypothetical protein K501DRAFT_326745 [Backusella circina FSU 941]|nr:hypothetical protein K501DRAFT_326745 [Backusella circina FSU 941]